MMTAEVRTLQPKKTHGAPPFGARLPVILILLVVTLLSSGATLLTTSYRISILQFHPRF